MARGLCYKRRPSIGQDAGRQPIPKTVDYDFWCGPAPRRPLHRAHLHYDWHWQWDYGNGDLGNQGIHQMDIARWGWAKASCRVSVLSVGGRFGYVDDGETANTQICVFDYGDAELIFEVRGLPTKRLSRRTALATSSIAPTAIWSFPATTSAIAYSNSGEVLQRFSGAGNHFTNFVEAVRSRRRDDLNADILEGHLSSALCHLGNISYRLGPAHRVQPAHAGLR